MPSFNTYRLTWVSLTLGVGYRLTAAPAKHSHCSLPWRRGYLLTAAPPDLERGVAPLGLPASMQPTEKIISGFATYLWASQVVQLIRTSCQCNRCRFDPWVGKIPWRRAWQPTPVFLPGEFFGRRSLVDYNWGCKGQIRLK